MIAASNLSSQKMDYVTYLNDLIDQKETTTRVPRASVSVNNLGKFDKKQDRLGTELEILKDLRVTYCDSDHPQIQEYTKAWKDQEAKNKNKSSKPWAAEPIETEDPPPQKKKPPKAKGFISSKE
mmetsp:Transcript_8313/g.12705  ORF Transcript_8313/g.12705 Transcript_8313/m.12705 type:complete len:124 (+) Transcript_8313:226-597(+)